MNNQAKTSVVFVILLLILSLVTTSFYYVSFEKEKKKRMDIEEQLNVAKDEKEAIQIKLKNISDEKGALESKVKENQSLISKLNDKLAQEIKTKELLRNEQETLRNKIVELSQDKNSFQEILDEKLQEIADLHSKLEMVASQKEDLQEKEAEEISEVRDEPVAEAAVDLEKIVVTPMVVDVVEEQIREEAAVEELMKQTVEVKQEAQKQSLSMEVLLINREYSFLVVNAGEDKGVKVDDIFEVFHNHVSLGRVKVEKVHERMSAANFLPGFDIDRVGEGDAANKVD